MKTQKANKGRRNFLFALGAAGAGAATVAIVKQTPQAATPEVPTQPQKGRGYQLTDHVRTYYKTARV